MRGVVATRGARPPGAAAVRGGRGRLPARRLVDLTTNSLLTSLARLQVDLAWFPEIHR
jgi:hypothetical protein